MDGLGVREPEIQEILGHDNRSTTHHYLKGIRKASRSAIEKMEQGSMRSRMQIKKGGENLNPEGKVLRKVLQHEKRSLKVIPDS